MEKDANFGDCTTCKHSLQVAEHEWNCMAIEYDIDTKKCWEPTENKTNHIREAKKKVL